MPEKDAVLHHVAEGIARITLNRPQALNAMDPGPVAKGRESRASAAAGPQ